jgi:hypothetical protein
MWILKLYSILCTRIEVFIKLSMRIGIVCDFNDTKEREGYQRVW